jgi:hypothetical protein
MSPIIQGLMLFLVHKGTLIDYLGDGVLLGAATTVSLCKGRFSAAERQAGAFVRLLLGRYSIALTQTLKTYSL